MLDYELFFSPANAYEGRPACAGVHRRHFSSDEAHFAMQIIERFALVAGDDGGEDSAGRHKLRRMEASEIAEFACDIAGKSFEEFKKRGWIIDIPSLKECEERAHAENGKNR